MINLNEVAEEIAGLNPRPINYDGVPRVTYSEPEVASVGLTTAEAKKRGHDVVELTYDLAGNGKAQILNTAACYAQWTWHSVIM